MHIQTFFIEKVHKKNYIPFSELAFDIFVAKVDSGNNNSEQKQ